MSPLLASSQCLDPTGDRLSPELVRGLTDTMQRPAAYLRTVKGYARVFSWGQLALFKLNDLLTAWVTSRPMRRIRALRLFAYAVPPESVTLDNGTISIEEVRKTLASIGMASLRGGETLVAGKSTNGVGSC